MYKETICLSLMPPIYFNILFVTFIVTIVLCIVVLHKIKNLPNVNASHNLKPMTGKEIADKLFQIHTHAGLFLKFELSADEHKYMDNPGTIVYREQDVLELLKYMGYPEPNWHDAGFNTTKYEEFKSAIEEFNVLMKEEAKDILKRYSSGTFNWYTSEGKTIHIDSMSNIHVINTYRMIKRNIAIYSTPQKLALFQIFEKEMNKRKLSP